MEQNEGIFARFMNERDFKSVVAEWVSRAVYGRLRRGPEGRTDPP
jgi:type I restriction enzyme, R subunit